jgi:hypothetical protein
LRFNRRVFQHNRREADVGVAKDSVTTKSGRFVQLGRAKEVQASDKRVSALYEQGSKSLAKMREAIFTKGTRE